MKKLPEIKHSCADIYKIIQMDIQNNILITAVKYKIFDHLEKPVSAESVARKCRCNTQNMELILNILAGMEIIRKKNGLYINTEKGSEILVSGNPEYLGYFFLHIHQWHTGIIDNLETQLRYGPVKHEDGAMTDASLWANSLRQSSAYHFRGASQYITETIKALPEFPAMKRMLDLGGGTGIYTIGIVSSHPDMVGVIFDQPAVTDVTREIIKEYEAENRIEIMAGDYITDSIGDSYDLIFASCTLNFHQNSYDELFKKIYNALNPGGVFVSHHDGITHERTKPVYHLGESLLGELNGESFSIEQGRIADAILKSGFRSVRSHTVQSDFGPMDIDIGLK